MEYGTVFGLGIMRRTPETRSIVFIVSHLIIITCQARQLPQYSKRYAILAHCSIC